VAELLSTARWLGSQAWTRETVGRRANGTVFPPLTTPDNRYKLPLREMLRAVVSVVSCGDGAWNW
jgi:hypothetical protein